MKAPARVIKILFRYAMSFDGINDYVVVPNSDNLLNGLKSASILVWVRTLALSPYHRFIAGWRNDVNSDFYILHYHRADYLEMRARTASGLRDLTPSFAGYYDKWTHIAFVRDGTVLKAYFNGALVASRGDMYDEPWGPSSNFSLGVRVVRLDSYYDGLIAQACAYSRALSAEEVALNYANPDNPVKNGLVLWLQADPQNIKDIDGDGVLEWIDLSGFGNHGKMYGATLVEVIKSPVRILSPVRVVGA